MRRIIAAALLALAFAGAAAAQSGESRTLELDGGVAVTYTLRTHPPKAHLLVPPATLAPDSALNAARLLNLHLSTGDIEEAALLSNSPRRRFEVLSEYRASVGENEFKRVFAQYFAPQNRLVAEIAIDRHRLLIWDLREGAVRIAEVHVAGRRRQRAVEWIRGRGAALGQVLGATP